MQRILSAISQYLANIPDQVRKRKALVLLIFAIATAIFIAGISRLKFDFTIEGWLKQDDAAFMAYNEFHDQFGSDDGVVIVYKPKDGNVFSQQSLLAIKGIRDDLINYRTKLKEEEKSALDHIVDVDCLINAVVLTVEDNLLISKALVGETVPSSREALAKIRATAESQKDFPLKYFSKDAQYAALYIKTDFGAIPLETNVQSASNMSIDMKAGDGSEENERKETPLFKPTDMADYVALNAELNQILNKPEYTRHLDYYKVGNTIDSDNQIKMGKEMGALYMAALLIMLISLFLIFRSFSGVVWPFLIVILSTVWTLGIAGFAGLSASAFVILTILLILTIGMADVVHIISGYLFFRNEGHDHGSAMRATYEKSGLSCLLTTVTTMAGMLSLNITDLVPINNFAMMSAIGVAVALIFTLYLLPILLEFWAPSPKVSRVVPNFALALQKILDKVIPAVEKRPRVYIVPFIVVFAISIYGAFKVKVDISIFDQYSKESNFYQSIKLMDEKMAGSSRISLYVDLEKDNGFQDPEVLRIIDDLQNKLERDYGKYVITTSSIVDVVKDAYQKQNEGREEMYIIPANVKELSQTLFMFNTADPEERGKQVSENYRKANITVSIRTYGSNEYKDVFENMKKDINAALDRIKKNYPDASVSITGIFAMGMVTANYLVVNELQSFGLSLLVISLILLVIFNSFKAGLISLIPNMIPSFLVLGILGLCGIPLDFYTMMLAPIIVGISVDDTIHFVTMYRNEVMKDNNIVRALKDTVKECGQAVVFTTMILGLGFGIMAIASTPGFSNLGKFGFLSIFSGLICELFLLPALIMVFKLKFKQEKFALSPGPSPA